MGISSVTTGSAVRALVWTGLACCLLGYAVTRTQKYARSLVAISAAEEPAAEFLFPAVSVCRPLGAGEEVEELLAAPLIKDVLYKVLAENGTRVKLMLKPDQTDEELPLGVDAGSVFEHSLFPPLAADKVETVCTTYRPPGNLKSQQGRDNGLMRVRIPTASAAPEKPYFFLYLNSYELLTPFHFFGANFFSVSAKDGVKSFLSLALEFGEKVSLNNWDRPCTEEEEEEEEEKKVFTRCLSEYLSRKVPCYGQDRNLFWKNCSPEELSDLTKQLELLPQGGEGEFIRRLGCRPHCRLPTVDVTLTASDHLMRGNQEKEEEEEEEGHIVVMLYAPRPYKTIKTEFLTYDLGNLAGELAAMVGGLTGLSVAAAYNEAHLVVARWMRGRGEF